MSGKFYSKQNFQLCPNIIIIGWVLIFIPSPCKSSVPSDVSFSIFAIPLENSSVIKALRFLDSSQIPPYPLFFIILLNNKTSAFIFRFLAVYAVEDRS